MRDSWIIAGWNFVRDPEDVELDRGKRIQSSKQQDGQTGNMEECLEDRCLGAKCILSCS